jgi:hypothetical protein
MMENRIAEAFKEHHIIQSTSHCEEVPILPEPVYPCSAALQYKHFQKAQQGPRNPDPNWLNRVFPPPKE